MENLRVKTVILNLFAYRDHIFGEGSTYYGFEPKTPNQNATQTHRDSFNSDQTYGKILYENKDGDILKSKPVMLKLSPKVSPSKWILFSFMNELIFFTKILPLLNTPEVSLLDLFPKFYHGEIIFDVEHDHSAIILEDLTFRGYRMAEKKSFLDYQHLALMMRKLGHFHAHSYKAKNTVPHLFYPLINNCPEPNPIVNGLEWFGEFAMSRGLHNLQKDSAYSAHISKITEMVHDCNNIFKQILTKGSNHHSVVVHGDYLRNNVMFKYENNIPIDLVIVDMATYRYGSPVIDLATVMYMHANLEMRTKHWDDLINEYYTSMKETFPENHIPSKDEILSEFVEKSFYAYLVASCFLPYLISYDNNTYSESFDDYYSSSDEESADIRVETASTSQDLKPELIPVDQTLGDILRDLIDRGFICKQ